MNAERRTRPLPLLPLATSAAPARPPWRSWRSRTDGFSLVEIAVTILIISVVAALAVPAWKKSVLSARSSAVVNDLRVFAGAYQTFAHDRGDWPPSTLQPGTFPAGMQTYLAETSWERVTPVGGRYAWATDTVQQGERYRAALLILSDGDNHVTSDRQLLLDIDHKIDDGNLDTGNFRLGFRNQPVYVLEP